MLMRFGCAVGLRSVAALACVVGLAAPLDQAAGQQVPGNDPGAAAASSLPAASPPPVASPPPAASTPPAPPSLRPAQAPVEIITPPPPQERIFLKTAVVGGGDVLIANEALWTVEIYISTPFQEKVVKQDHLEERLHDGSSNFMDHRQTWDVDHICGGVMIAPDWVLTAKHCITHVPSSASQDPISFFSTHRHVRVGTHVIKPEFGTLCPPVKVVLHPGNGDLALIQLDARACTPQQDGGKPIPIRLAKPNAWKHFTERTTFAVYGWGMTRKRAPDALAAMTTDKRADDNPRYLDPQSAYLKKGAPIYFVPHDACRAVPGYTDYVTDTMVCAGVPDGSIDQCNGDSGGPLVYDPSNGHDPDAAVLVGIVHGSEGCGLAHTPGVYEYAPAFTHWIASVIGHGDVRAGRAILAKVGHGTA